MNHPEEGTIPEVTVIICQTPVCPQGSPAGSSAVAGVIDFYTLKHEVGADCPEERARKCKSFKGFSYCYLLAGVNPLKSETLWINEPRRHGNFCQKRKAGQSVTLIWTK